MRTWLVVSIALVVLCIIFWRFANSERASDALSTLDVMFLMLIGATALDWAMLLLVGLIRGLS